MRVRHLSLLVAICLLASCTPEALPQVSPEPEPEQEPEVAQEPEAEPEPEFSHEDRVREPFAVEIRGRVPTHEAARATTVDVDGDWVTITAAPGGIPEAAEEPDDPGVLEDVDEDDLIDTDPSDPRSGMTVHRVEEGESFWSIARDYGVPLDELADANLDVDPGRLQPGMELRIPSGESEPEDPNDADR